MTQSLDEAILAIDIGTSSVRAIALSPGDGSLLAETELPTPTRRRGPESACLDPDEIWTVVCTAASQTARRVDVLAIGVTAQIGTVMLGQDSSPITPILLWSDRTAASSKDAIAAAVSAEGLPDVGRRVAAEHAAVRLHHLRDSHPADYERIATILSLKDYIVLRMTGRTLTDPTHASYTLAFDIVRGAWSSELLRAIRAEERWWPAVCGGNLAAGDLTKAAATAIGVRAGTIVAVGGPDGTIGSLGAGALSAGTTVDIAGSTDVLVSVVDRPLLATDAGITANAHPLPGLWTAGGATGLTGGAVAWLAELLRFDSVGKMHAELGAALDRVPPGAGGVLMDTALTGRRFPHWDPSTTGGIRGLRPETTAAELLAAAQEGSAFLVAEGLDLLHEHGAMLDEVTVVGGVARRPQLLQLRADTWGLPVVGIGDGMATARGAAILAAAAAGLYRSVEDAAHVLVARGETFEPDATRSALFTEARRSWREALFGEA